MKVKNKISKKVIEVTQDHYDQVLSRQGWLEVVEEVKEKEEKVIPLVAELKKELKSKSIK